MEKREIKKQLKQVIRGAGAELYKLERKNAQHLHDVLNDKESDKNIELISLALITAQNTLAYLEKKEK